MKMKDLVQVVDLNDFELDNALKIAEHVRRAGKGYRRHYATGHDNGDIRFFVEEASDSKIMVHGTFGVAKFKFIVKGDNIIFSTTNSAWPVAFYYDFARFLSLEIEGLEKILEPDLKAMETFSANINDYYLVNNGYQEAIAESFQRFISMKDANKHATGMFFIGVGSAAFGDEPLRRLSRAFAESSLFEDVAFAFVFCRGRGVPVFYAEGGIYYLLAERDFYESFQKDFARLFAKASGKRLNPVFDLKINTKKE